MQTVHNPSPPSSTVVDDADPPQSTADHSAATTAGGGGVSSLQNNARYKLMSPAKLPITRSPCLTIPPGLSPTSFLESPVLLSNFKGEPSPTTGSFFKPQMMHSSSAGSSAFLHAVNSSTGTELSQSGSFEFKPNAGSFSMAGFSLSGSLASSTDVNQQQQQIGQAMQSQVDRHSQSPEPSVAVKSELMLTDDRKSTVASSGSHLLSIVEFNEFSHKAESSNHAQASQCEQKALVSQVLTERTSEDGYNWRKYGQKLVKGSEFPRSYYKCTHPNCEVKKLFERSPDGQITEIIYKGTHDHPKPQPNRRLSAGSMMSSLEEKSDRFPLIEQEGKPGDSYCQTTPNNEQCSTPDLSPGGGNDNNGDTGGPYLNRIPDDADEDDPFAKRRRMEIGEMDINSVVKPIREPRVVVQTVSEVDILDDGYRWRKYGQKVVRGNPNPRSYYKCTFTGCPVRKHVERASHDPKAVITTYEGKHNHEVPTARNSNNDTSSRMGPHDGSDPVSLDLGVGLRPGSDFAPGQSHGMGVGQGLGQAQYNSRNLVMLQSGQFSTFPGYVNGGMTLYGSRENHNQGQSIGNQPVNHSVNPYQQNMGRILMGP
ncbi:hypothetical protein RND81_09G060000 [Saponaria officinalis]|uniref:WRKY domain-containing protein n=1 Tax=Saponaria officinalis TaxID=3572 RepID=A0AAW1IIF3_SAPOF